MQNLLDIRVPVALLCSLPVFRDPSIVVSYLAALCPLMIYVKSRAQAFKIAKPVMVLYNLSQVTLSVYIVVVYLNQLPSLWGQNNVFGFNTPDNETLRFLVWLHYYNKWLDLLDTIFIVMRKSWRQLSFLHVFHHATIGPVWFVVLEARIGIAAYAFGALMNSIVHAVMYTHYLVTGLGFRNPLKSYVTSVQMAQFCIVLCHSVYAAIFHQGDIPLELSLLQLLYMCSMLYLFKRQVVDAREAKGAPNTIKEYEPLEMTIDGDVYDVSEYGEEHPGGLDLMKNFHEQDVTTAFHAMHDGHAKVRALEALAKLKKTEGKKDTRCKEFEKLRDGLKERGLFANSWLKLGAWMTTTLALLLAAVQLAIHGGIAGAVLGGVLGGVAWSHCGFIAHHAGHCAFTGRPQKDHFIQGIFEGFCKGGSGRWWRQRHHYYHSVPEVDTQRMVDADIHTTPFFAWDQAHAARVPEFLLKIQSNALLSVLIFPMLLAVYVPVFFFTTKLFMVRNRHWDECGMVALHFAAVFYFFHGTPLLQLLLSYGIASAVQGTYLGVFYSLSHFNEVGGPSPLAPNAEWDTAQVLVKKNYCNDSTIMTWMCGFMNYQIEHHLFPTMPPFSLRTVTKDVQQHCAQQKLPYRAVGFTTAIVQMTMGMRAVAEAELQRRTVRKTQ